MCKECIERKRLGIPLEVRKKKIKEIPTETSKKKRGRPFGTSRENIKNRKEFENTLKDININADLSNSLVYETDLNNYLLPMPELVPLIPIDLTMKSFYSNSNYFYQDLNTGSFNEDLDDNIVNDEFLKLMTMDDLNDNSFPENNSKKSSISSETEED